MKDFGSQLQKDLAKRSKELRLCWGELNPEQMGCFLSRDWVLVVDDRLEGTRAVVVIPIKLLANVPFVLETLSTTAKLSKKKPND